MNMSWTKRWMRRLRTLFRRNAVERELNEEVAFHIEMEAEKLRRTGLSPDEARRQAALAFGGAENVKEEVRDARWLGWLPGFALDFKLGARMLVKSPGLAIVGCLAMAVAVAISAGAYALVNTYFFPQIPLHEGDRVISIMNWDSRRHYKDPRVLHDFAIWRRELRSLVDLGVFRTVKRNLIAPSGEVEPIALAEMSASGFRIARTPPVLGRTLLDADERPGAPPVIVIGERVWKTRFNSDPAILGRTMRLGHVPHAIVGVMPEEFSFPVNHSYWMPLGVEPEVYEPGTGPSFYVFGRLAPGITRDEAQAELKVIGSRVARGPENAEVPLLPRIVPYTDIVTNSEAEGEGAVWQIIRLVVSLLLVLVAMNVAILVYARTINRAGEIAIRTALGATRRRIVAQLFAEALVLSLASALVGLGMVAIGLRWLDNFMLSGSATGQVPFWIDPGLSVPTVLYALALAVVSALIVGVLPALRATGLELRDQMGSSGAGSKARLGATWNALIVVQVAVAVAILPPALLKAVELVGQSMRPVSFPAEQFLSAWFLIELEEESEAEIDEDAHPKRVRETLDKLMSRLSEEPGVTGVALSGSLPWSGGLDPVEVEGRGVAGKPFISRVSAEWFDLFDVPLLEGRNFVPADAELSSNSSLPVIVNRTFVTEMLGGEQAVGRRIRYQSDYDQPNPWNEIVGVVEDFPLGFKVPGMTSARVYHATSAGAAPSGVLTIRLQGGDAAAFIPTLRRVAASVDPMMQLSSIGPLSESYAEETSTFGRIALGIAVATGSVLLLSAAGIHSLISFTVNQRRREIGIRTALGGSARRILSSILGRAAGRVGIGVAVGLGLALLADWASGGVLMSGGAMIAIPLTAVFAILIGLTAAIGPARRALRVEPTEALRAE